MGRIIRGFVRTRKPVWMRTVDRTPSLAWRYVIVMPKVKDYISQESTGLRAPSSEIKRFCILERMATWVRTVPGS